MRVGVPKEIKVHEYRVGLVPASVRELVTHGHEVFVETGAAERMGFADDDYRRAGATIAANAAEVFANADMIVKVKEPQAAEREMLREGQTLFTYLHLAPDPAPGQGADALGRDGDRLRDGDRRARRAAAAVADERGRRPHVDPGRRALPGDGAGRTRHAARRRRPAWPRPRSSCIGGGVSGVNAVRMAIGLEAAVTCIDINVERLVRARPAVRRLGQHHLLDARRRSRTTCCRPISSSAPCWCPAPRRRS